MKKMKWFPMVLCLVLLASLLTACGGDSKGFYAISEDGVPQAASYNSAVSESASSMRGAGADTGAADAAQPPENRKWIVTVNMDAETENLDEAIASIMQRVAGLNGYVEDQSIYNGSAYSTNSSRRYRNASLTIRIPADQVDSFTETMAGIANVVSNSKNLRDITLTYTTTANRVEALETEQARLMELLSQAENMSDLLEIESRLTDVRYELENYASKLRLYDNQIDYATLYLGLREVQEYTPTEEITTWERIRNGFTGSIQGLGESLMNLLVWLIVSSPFLVVYGAIAAVIILLVRKGSKKRRAKKAAQLEQAKRAMEKGAENDKA